VGTYANAFILEPGRCFRLVENDEARGQPVSCPNPVTVRGRWRDGGGKLRVVEACAEHGAEIEERRPAKKGLARGVTAGELEPRRPGR
jgi:hypothetical protein